MNRIVSVCVVLITPCMALSHTDDPKARSQEAHYQGPGCVRCNAERRTSAIPPILFPAQNITLLSWVSIADIQAHFDLFDIDGAMDCWGYTSPSGRRYAIMALTSGTVFLEITDPQMPIIVEHIPGATSGWRDMKVYQHYAYSVNETANGIQVIDLSNIDNGIVVHIQDVTEGGTLETHNVAVNEQSGYLYRAGGGSSSVGLRIYDLADPADPTLVASWNDKYCHDAQVVNWTAAPYAGSEIAFCFGGFNNGYVKTGLTILDVTDKQDIKYISEYEYAGGAYSHQGWLSADRQHLYVNDELDEDESVVAVTTTHVINIQDLQAPFEESTFTTGRPNPDHNLYTLNNLIFEANYSSGLHVFDAQNPTHPVEIAQFDTRPEDDAVEFLGLWSVYPYFGNGIVIGSDRQRGLFVWQLDLDCNSNGIFDHNDITSGTSTDCDGNWTPDECQIDCNANGTADVCDIASAPVLDCPGTPNGIIDTCETDCDGDGIVDSCAVAMTAQDCNADDVPDSCQLSAQTDCDGSGILDVCESIAGYILLSSEQFPFDADSSQTFDLPIVAKAAADVNMTITIQGDFEDEDLEFAELLIEGQWIGQLLKNTDSTCENSADESIIISNTDFNSMVADGQFTATLVASSAVGECLTSSAQLTLSYPALGADCNANAALDECEIDSGLTADVLPPQGDNIPDVCQSDCNSNAVPDYSEILSDSVLDCNANWQIDQCDIASGISTDVIGIGANSDGIPDECQSDCDADLVPDNLQFVDCNENGQYDACDFVTGLSQDCNNNDTPDSCDLNSGVTTDCDDNGVPDECDIAIGASVDCDANGIPDECEIGPAGNFDCNDNGTLDKCDIASAVSEDCNANGVPDECDLVGAFTLVPEEFQPSNDFGRGVAIHSGIAVVGAVDHYGTQGATGAAFVFTSDPVLGWIQRAELFASDGESHDDFGWSISTTGQLIAIGAPQQNGATGAAYLFEQQVDGNWTEIAKLTADDGQAGDRFGDDVVIDGQTILVTANQANAVYIFEQQLYGAWSQTAKLSAPGSNANFSPNAVLSDDTIVIGTPYDSELSTWRGSALVYERQADSNWTQTAKLIADDGLLGDTFGWSVALSSDKLLIGAPHKYFTPGEGRAYVFKRQPDGSWSQHDTIAPTSSSASRFGVAVALGSQGATIGAESIAGSPFNSGGLYLFREQIDGSWQEITYYTASSNDQFAHSIAVSDELVLVGAADFATIYDWLDEDFDGYVDACETCQQDIGFAGPGNASLSLCGGNLESGTSADLCLKGTPPNAAGWLLFGDVLNPTPIYGGTLVPLPSILLLPTLSDAYGMQIATINGGSGPSTYYLQVVYEDDNLPHGWGITNALQAEFLP